MTAVIYSGAVANKPFNGGEAWIALSWTMGLLRLGCDVHFVEQIDPGSCVDAEGNPAEFERSANLEHFHAVFGEFGLADRATLVCGSGERTSGLEFRRLLDLADSCDLLVNYSGHLELDPLMRRIGRKAYVDGDPGFTQFWHAQGHTGARLEGHDLYFTVGENIGRPGCPIPTEGLDWRPVRQPVVLDEWPATPSDDPARFTTIGSWRGPYGPVEHDGRTYGLKVHEFRKLIDLPSRAPLTFELALDIHPGDDRDRDALLAHQWRLVEPRKVAPDPSSFRHYLQTSGGEFSVAQGVYVKTRSGWFSDRTVRYLASGKPALVQDTGFGKRLFDEGLVTFTGLDDAAEGARRIHDAYDDHAEAARAFAREHFDSEIVLARFLERAGLG